MAALPLDMQFDFEGTLVPLAAKNSVVGSGLPAPVLVADSLRFGLIHIQLGGLPAHFKAGDRFRAVRDEHNALGFWWMRQARLLYFSGNVFGPLQLDSEQKADLVVRPNVGITIGFNKRATLLDRTAQIGEWRFALKSMPSDADGGAMASLTVVHKEFAELVP